jgi:hypothetical protein
MSLAKKLSLPFAVYSALVALSLLAGDAELTGLIAFIGLFPLMFIAIMLYIED